MTVVVMVTAPGKHCCDNNRSAGMRAAVAMCKLKLLTARWSVGMNML